MKKFKRSVVFVFILSLIITSFVNVSKVEAVNACPGTPTVPHGGKVYDTVQVGTQCWLKQNLNVGTKINTTPTSVLNQTNNNITEKYCYNNLDTKCDAYGGLYQWAEAVQYKNTATNATNWSPVPTTVQGICPIGWHIPSRTEADTMIAYLGGDTVAGGKIKEAGALHWYPGTSAVPGSNTSGLTVLGTGYQYNGSFGNLNIYGFLWTTTPGSANDVHYYGAGYNFPGMFAGRSYKNTGYPVRCLKDDFSPASIAQVSISSNPSLAMAGNVTFTATPVNGGTTPTYQWKKTTTTGTTNIPGATSSTYSGAVTGGDIISVVMNSNLPGATGNPATSNTITVASSSPIITAPSVPLNLTGTPGVTAEGKKDFTKVNLTWNTPASNGNSPITAYEVEYKRPWDSTWTTVSPNPTTTSHTVTGLIVGDPYKFVVSAINAAGAVTGTTGPGAMIEAPGKVLGVTAVPNGTGKLLVSWDPPSNGGTNIIDYRCSYKEETTSTNVFCGTISPTSNQTEIINLISGKKYQVKIRAVGVTFGPWSDNTPLTLVASIPSQSLIGGAVGGYNSLTGAGISQNKAVELPDTFTTNLSYGKKHDDVKQLQSFLNSKGYKTTEAGKETTYFGNATKQALIKFQQDNNITPAIGNFGIKTRTLINELINAEM